MPSNFSPFFTCEYIDADFVTESDVTAALINSKLIDFTAVDAERLELFMSSLSASHRRVVILNSSYVSASVNFRQGSIATSFVEYFISVNLVGRDATCEPLEVNGEIDKFDYVSSSHNYKDFLSFFITEYFIPLVADKISKFLAASITTNTTTNVKFSPF